MKRWVGIRHLRYYWHSFQLARWMGLWAPYGSIVPSPRDLEYLQQVWEGKT